MAEDKTKSGNSGHEWLFLLTGKNTQSAGWWLKIRDQYELALYLSATDTRYANAFTNYLRDKEYQLDSVEHGPYPAQAGLTLASYLHALSTKTSFIDSLLGLRMTTATAMSKYLAESGVLYVNINGGWNTGHNGKPYGEYTGDFARSKSLVWPNLSRNDIRISQFPGGKHFYAHIGPVQVRKDGVSRFNTRQEARTAAEAYIIDKEE